MPTGDDWVSKGSGAVAGATAHLSRGPAAAAEGAVLSFCAVWISPGAVGPRPVSLAEEKVRAIRLRALSISHTCTHTHTHTVLAAEHLPANGMERTHKKHETGSAAHQVLSGKWEGGRKATTEQ